MFNMLGANVKVFYPSLIQNGNQILNKCKLHKKFVIRMKDKT